MAILRRVGRLCVGMFVDHKYLKAQRVESSGRRRFPTPSPRPTLGSDWSLDHPNLRLRVECRSNLDKHRASLPAAGAHSRHAQAPATLAQFMD